jgi:outer membrane receptor protein involved in Fe transport
LRRRSAALLLLAPSVALAQSAPAPAASPQTGPPAVLPQVDVVGSTPLLGAGIDRDKVPSETNVLNRADLARDGNADLLRSLNEQLPGVTLDNAAGNPYQPNLLYHGFTASPLQGNAQGLAVYLNGVRFNQAFGDTVNWDLIPDIAIDRINLEGSNPVFGLNALGGALSVQTKNGFTYQGGEASLMGGSFGKIEGQFQYGIQRDNTAGYIAGTIVHEGGWRDLQSTDLYNILGDLGWRSDIAELHINVVAANTTLNGPGTSPVELLAVAPSAQFTAPNLIANKYLLLSTNANVQVAPKTSIQGVVYYENFLQKVVNGNVTDFNNCTDGSLLLCDSGGNYALDRAGNPIPAFNASNQYSELDLQSTNTNSYGVSAQVTNTDDILGFHNHVVLGVSYDGSRTQFSGSAEEGGLTTLDRVFVGPGITLDTPADTDGPVEVGITTNYEGVFVTDTLDLTSRLSLSIGGRLNIEQIDLKDQIGTALTGNHSYGRFNPSIGLTYKLTPWLTAYVSYSESNRAPTPAELSCASAAAPCSLANFFVGDPGLKQVVGHTFEAGLRGQTRLDVPLDNARLGYNLGLFHTNLDDDIIFVNSPVQGRAFFENVGVTRRQGVDAGLSLKNANWLAFLNYSYTDATFQSGFVESSQNNPGADANGDITVNPGNRLPGVPAHLLKFGVGYKVTPQWAVGVNGNAASGQYLFGDEANLQQKLPGYIVFNLNTSYQVSDHVQIFGIVENITDRKYYSYGTFSPTTSIYLAQAPGATNPRSYSPAAPVGGFAGVRVTF